MAEKLSKKELVDLFYKQIEEEKNGIDIFEGYLTEFFNKNPYLVADREVVMTAVTHDGNLFPYVDKSLSADKEVVLSALQELKHRCVKANELNEFYSNEESYKFLDNIDKSLWKDADICRLALEVFRENAIDNKYIHESMWADKEFVLSTFDLIDFDELKDLPFYCYKKAHESIQMQKDVTLAYLNRFNSYDTIHKYLIGDIDIVKKLISHTDEKMVEDFCISNPQIYEKKDLCLEIIQNVGWEYYGEIKNPDIYLDKDIIKSTMNRIFKDNFEESGETDFEKFKEKRLFLTKYGQIIEEINLNILENRGPSRAKVSDMMFASQEEGNLWESEHWSSFGHEYDE